MKLQLKRVYETATPSDGTRVLVDRIWPRGLTKEKAAVDVWLKEIAPSTQLRRWFNHDAERWAEFLQRYHAELDANDAAVQQLRELIAKKGALTLVYGAKDEEHNQAVALSDYVQAEPGQRKRQVAG